MDLKTLKKQLAHPRLNMLQLARDTGINPRTLHRIKSGATKDVMLDTVQRLERGLALQSL